MKPTQYPSLRPSDDILSDQWRIMNSRIQDLELANALRSARTIINTLYPNENIHLAYWDKSQSIKDMTKGSRYKPLVTLDAGVVIGEYPIPGKKLDILCGHAVHEAMHLYYDSHNITVNMKLPDFRWLPISTSGKPTKYFRRDTDDMVPILGKALTPEKQDVVRKALKEAWDRLKIVGEEIFVDNIRPGILKMYIDRIRAHQVDIAEELDWTDPWQVWMYCSVFNIMPDINKITPEIYRYLGPLLNGTKMLKPRVEGQVLGLGKDKSPSRLLDDRRDVYKHIWNQIWRFVAEDALIDDVPQQTGAPISNVTPSQGDGNTPNKDSTDNKPDDNTNKENPPDIDTDDNRDEDSDSTPSKPSMDNTDSEENGDETEDSDDEDGESNTNPMAVSPMETKASQSMKEQVKDDKVDSLFTDILHTQSDTPISLSRGIYKIS